jgi:S-adenosylmethionine:tRNA ribosyltransferase-isomerase
MRTVDFDFHLPPELIAQTPAPARDQSRLLVLHRNSGGIEHRQFKTLPDFLRAGDVLVLNNSRVIPARLRGRNARTSGQFEMLLLEENAINDWWALLRPGKRARIGTEILITAGRGRDHETPLTTRNTHPEHQHGLAPTGSDSIRATVIETNSEGHRRLRFSGTQNIFEALDRLGEVPLPPYIAPDQRRAEQDRERYQTVYAQPAGSVAAPTAGLHFTNSLLDEARARGVRVCFVTLHVGLGTFAPVKAETLSEHEMHEERFELSAETAQAVNAAKAAGRRIVAVGTTTVRVLESVAAANTGRLVAGAGRTRIFIYPPRDFGIVDGLLTNFHLPCSTLLMLASAFAAPGETRGREMVLSAYAEAIRERYRFFSYGDAMFIL